MGGGSGVQYQGSSSCPTDVHCVCVSSSCCCGFGKEASSSPAPAIPELEEGRVSVERGDFKETRGVPTE
jgi:hypothetical protein